ncbi:histidine phosphotransferase [Roseovarius sp. SCSIO 43702]|uniref:histidine phosphotransferase family protein n=1 Tax=Roseovarius sp. SCSIO 43702 TaxID=2823043 RepID=UPI001C7338DE|nr:histidine phosphotransferase family protein [Roseovarius sp. SCSIO 43702]QYX55471.1 histidine phosphotransferase [Roseovarius sp. SCSIO 43702]
MTLDSLNIATLLGSRICHDLISPVGAISNGLELMSLGGGSPDGPEFALVGDSAAHASARIRFFRIAFGQVGPDQRIAAREMREVLAPLYTGHQRLDWRVEGDLPRARARAAFLGLLCLEKCIGRGGTITVTGDASALRLVAAGDPLALPDTWDCLTSGNCPADLPPAMVQFALLPLTARDLDLKIDAQATESEAIIAF